MLVGWDGAGTMSDNPNVHGVTVTVIVHDSHAPSPAPVAFLRFSDDEIFTAGAGGRYLLEAKAGKLAARAFAAALDARGRKPEPKDPDDAKR